MRVRAVQEGGDTRRVDHILRWTWPEFCPINCPCDNQKAISEALDDIFSPYKIVRRVATLYEERKPHVNDSFKNQL